MYRCPKSDFISIPGWKKQTLSVVGIAEEDTGELQLVDPALFSQLGWTVSKTIFLERFERQKYRAREKESGRN